VVPAGREARRALLLPGNDLGAAFYRPLGEALATRGVTAVLLEQPGGAPAWDAHLDEVAAVWEEHASAGAALVGHSLGGLLALLLAARRPAGLSRLVLLEPMIPPWRWLARQAAARYRRDVVLRDRDRFVNWTGTYRRVHRPDAFPPAALEHYVTTRREADPARASALFDALPDLYPLPLAAVRAPTLVVRGAHSGWRLRLGHALLRRRLGARGVTIPDAAHWLANEADAAVAGAIAAFCEGPAGGG
jgi:pimeloyl-ACP methyl ester carboxylesterase